MSAIRRFEDIQAWQKARELVREVYIGGAAKRLGKDFDLRDQLRRAAISSMSNIAEGFARKSDRDFARFLDIARGSGTEVQSLLYIVLDAGYINKGEFDRLYKMAGAMAAAIGGFTSYLRKLPG